MSGRRESGWAVGGASVRGRRRLAGRGLAQVCRVWAPGAADLMRVVPSTGATLAAVVAARARRRPHDPVWVDDRGELTAGALWLAIAARVPSAGGTVVVHTGDQRLALITVVAEQAAGGRAVVVPVRAGRAALAAARGRYPGAWCVTDQDPAPPMMPDPPGGRAGPGRWRRAGGTLVFATSGTTGPARSIAHAAGLGAAAQMLGALGAFPPLRRPLVASAAAIDHGHGFGLLAATLVLGGTFVALPPGPADAAALLADRGRPVDLLSGVPRQLADLAELPPATWAGTPVRRVLSGSDRLDAATAAAVTGALTPELYNAYGATETGTVCVATPRDLAEAPGTVGRPVTGVLVRVVDEVGMPVAAGEDGRLEIRSPLSGPQVFTGDRGRIDRDGRVHVLGRADGAVVTGGETVDPGILRRALLATPGVLAAEVTLAPDRRFGARLVADVTVASAGPVDVDQWRRRLRRDLGPALTPREIQVHPAGGPGGGAAGGDRR
ncbi:MAG: AMP-binding protein [Acidimicrobiales bacterium]